MADRTVILTTLNDAWSAPNSVIDLFLESFRIGEGTDVLLNHLLIVAMDQKAFDRCKFIHPHCYSLQTEGVDFSPEKIFMSPDYLKMMWRRIEFLRTVLQLGYSFVFTDADILWFRNPFLQFPPAEDMLMASDIFMGDPSLLNNLANGGFNYVRSNSLTIEFYKYWHMARKLYPGSHDQDVFDELKRDGVTRMGLKLKFLDTAYFGGFCQPAKDLNKVCTMHANCCVGIERKLHDLRLVLEDWRNYKMLSTEQKRNVTWRAPSACKAIKTQQQ
ncbi:uncharacterized protein At4g15970-like [Aristolochia californica]|uniref:uncharacterized protein At4g15970-like n=1 Tax=Aristolochia californica TaxID=171875 RepID=UPI0035DBD8CF